ncbi:MAG: hypothetical protein V4501_12555 [Pseudomonadota bacterium]
MKAKLLMLVFAMLILAGCQGSGAGCGGCVSGYWSTSCNIPNSGGASESQFTQVANPWQVTGDYSYSGWDGNDSGCSCSTSYATGSSCGSGCGGGGGWYSSGPNW